MRREPLSGQRVYAVGDIHGRLDLLDILVRKIDQDDRSRPSADTLLVFLGDLVDRGPSSKEVIDRIMGLKQDRPSTILLKGNHEEILIRAYHGDKKAAGLFHRVGGRETMLSYGVAADVYDHSELVDLPRLVSDHVPAAHIAFLEDFQNYYVNGDYLFVHAGIRPEVAIEDQQDSDLRWIRSAFLDHRGSHGRLVIHGHSIMPQVDEKPNRIGIDTGAFATGRLTAIGLEGRERWFLSTEGE